ncbi:MAG TPA: radical SAM family heme chaperone HemW [Gemmatimonadaceae bacterium]|nr:radical SAM family heme chaperone HemW [Gemmatimonadaceae bacterium]
MLPRHLYVHVPFCARRCVYCDFSIAVRRDVPVDDYVSAVARELEIRFAGAERFGEVSTLYLGGGTPSRLGGAGVSRLLEMLTRRIEFAPDAEVTLEANPDDVTSETAKAWRNAGVNRLSIGAQSFDDGVLSWMHRTHDASQIGRAVDAARRAGIDDVSVDLIFSLPEKTQRSWAADLEQALALEPTHVSLYGLTIEPHTPLGRWRQRGEVDESPDERYEAEFLTAHETLAAAGFDHYEVSNFARPGRRARHNSSYWKRVPYTGIGPSSHGFDGTERRWNEAAYAEWCRLLAEGSDPLAGRELLTAEDVAAERVYLGLRTIDGLTLTTDEITRVSPWVEHGWALLRDGDRAVLTPQGWLRLDALAADLTVERSRYYV